MIKANDPKLTSWVEVDKGSDFPIQNIPFGVIKDKNGKVRCASRIGNYVIDLYELASLGYFDDVGINDLRVFKKETLNDFIAFGKPAWRAVRNKISELFEEENSIIKDNPEQKARILSHILDVEMLMPVQVGDYTDFYSSIEHATNVGKMFRDPDNALLPNWKHIPVGYHGRSSSIVTSGTPIHRPKGQTKADDADIPTFGPSRLYDFELEMAFITGGNQQNLENIFRLKKQKIIFSGW